MATVDNRTRGARTGGWLAVALLLAGAGPAFAGEVQTNVFAIRARTEFQDTQARFQAKPDDPAAAWQFARAAFDYADFATNRAQRAGLARQGIAACRELLPRETNSAPLHYYLAENYGQLAQAQAPSLASYRLVKVMEREFKTAADLDPSFDYAGPERSLGLLYRDAPGWPFSIGSRRKARERLEQAVKLAPDYPGNRLYLVESFLQWHDTGDAKTELKALDALWPVARTNLTGKAWEKSWHDWSARREAVRQKLAETSAPAKPPRSNGK